MVQTHHKQARANSDQTSLRGWGNPIVDYLKNPHRGDANFLYLLFFLVALAFLILLGWAFVETIKALYTSGTNDSERVRFFIYLLTAIFSGPLLLWAAVIRQSNLNLTRRAHVAEIYQKASDSLGVLTEKTVELESEISSSLITKRLETEKTVSQSFEARVAAMYALERLGQLSEDDLRAVRELLSAFVRSQKTIDDRELALQILARSFNARSSTARPALEINLVASDLRGLRNRPFNFFSADLSNSVFIKLSSPRFHATDCKLNGALLIKLAVAKKQASFSSCTFESTLASGADLPETKFHKSGFVKTDFEGANLEGAVFDTCTFEGSRFAHASLAGASFVNCDMKNVCFDEAWLVGTKFKACKMEPEDVSARDAVSSTETSWSSGITFSQDSPTVLDDEQTVQEHFGPWNSKRLQAIEDMLVENRQLIDYLDQEQRSRSA